MARLQQELGSGILPPALLFVGPDYSGKGSAALELARARTCTGGDPDVPWQCRCTACTQQRHLMHPETLLLGGRYFGQEIHVATNALKRDRREALRYLLERAVRKLSRRFDPVLWEGDTARLGKAEPILEQIDATLTPYLPGATLPDDRHFAEGLDKIEDLAEKLETVVNLDAVPVDVIRRLNRWARISPSGPAKVALIENVDHLGESAQNALLKTLEEPPATVTFVMTTSRRGAVMPTILSRAREYLFTGRGAEESSTVIERIFRDTAPATPSIRDYFLGLDGGGLRPMAERFLSLCRSGDEIELAVLDEIGELISNLGRSEGFHYFLEELTDLLRAEIRSGAGGTTRELERWRRAIAVAQSMVEQYNLSPARVLERLFHTMAREKV